MASKDAVTAEEYLAGLPADRAEAIGAVRDVVLQHLPKGMVEEIRWGMLCYEIPLSIEPDTYNGQPLQYVALASKKNYMSLYLNGVYGDANVKEKFVESWKATGNRLDMGASCVRFKKLDQVPLDVVADAIAAFDVDTFVGLVASVHAKT